MKPIFAHSNYSQWPATLAKSKPRKLTAKEKKRIDNLVSYLFDRRRA